MQHIEKSRFLLIILVLAALGFSPAPRVQAQPWEVVLGESNQLPDGQQYGIVSLDHIFDGGKRGVAITVTINDEVLSPSSNYDIRNFSFNTTVINPATSLLIGLPELWAAQFGPVKLSEFGRFHITVAAEDSSQTNPLVIEMYHITDDLSYTDFTVANRDNRLFAAHIVDSCYSSADSLSAYFAPEENPTIACKTTTTTTPKPTTTTTKNPTTTTTKNPTTTTSNPTTTSSVLTTTTTSMPTTTTTSPPTTTSSISTTTTTIGPCVGEISLGRECPGEPIDGKIYNRPGRRGMQLTCSDVVDLTVCTNCFPFDPACLEWTITPNEQFLTIIQIDECCWRLIIDESCDVIQEAREFEITVTDTCNDWSDSIIVEIGKVSLEIGSIAIPLVSDAFEVPVNLVNYDHHVKALSFDIYGCDGDDNLQCTGCMSDSYRSSDFTCAATEQADGSCRVVLFSLDPSALILHGAGPVLNVTYSNTGEVSDCVCLSAMNRQVSDRFNEELCSCQGPGEVCFKSCGDIYPQDCVGGACGSSTCGDGVVDIFDVMEAVDIILGLQEPTACQTERANVPNGKPPYCGEPAGVMNCERDADIDMLDVLVIMDVARSKYNCCEYCLLKE
jgi:hypothetical protein